MIVLALTFRSFTSTLFPVRTIGMFSQTLTRSPIANMLVKSIGQVAEIRLLTVPVGNILVGNSGCDIKHDDTALSIDVVSITKTAEFFLACSIPDIELDLSKVLY